MQPKFNRIPNLVSVVISSYNASDYLLESIDSIAQQTYKPIEIIVINDGSTDKTDQIIQSWMEQKNNQPLVKNNQFIYLKLPHNIGYSGAFTTGYFLARGEFIAMQAADDISHPQRIEKQVQYLREHQEIDLVGTDLSLFNDRNFDNQWQMQFVQYGWENISRTYFWGSHCISHGTILFRGEIFDRLGGLERYPQGKETVAEDYYFINKYFQNGIRIDNIPEVLYYYRSHPSQRSKNETW